MYKYVVAINMEPKYLVALAAVGLFFILLIIFFILLAHRRRKEEKLQAWLNNFYSDKNLIKQDYETNGEDEIAVPDDRSVRQSEDNSEKNGEENEEIQLKIEEAFPKIESEGIEEITGYYNPEQ